MTNYLANYAHFTSKEKMDMATRQHVMKNWNDMHDTDRAVLEMTRCYSVKYGAAHLKHDTIANALNKSNVTIRRAIRKLEKLGIIERIHYIRPIMSGLGTNIYSILPFGDQSNMTMPESDEKRDNDKVEETKSPVEPLSFKSINTKDLKKTSPTEPVSTTLFGRMKSLLSLTTGDLSLARKVFGVYRHQSLRMLKFSIYENKGELFEDLAYRALHITVHATKRKKIRNFVGYYAGVLSELIDEALFSNIHQEYDAPVEGLYFISG